MLNPPRPAASALGPLGPLLKNLALAYLLLPVVLFLVCWLRPVFAIPALLVLGFAVLRCRAVRQPGAQSVSILSALTWQHAAMLLYCLALAWLFCLWTVPAPGALPFWDYAKHDVLLHNLVDYPWPVTFFTEADGATVLRYTLAFYLPPALLAKWLGGQWAQACLFGWTVLGVWLFFALVANRARHWLFAMLAVPLAALFSGLDVLAYWGTHGSLQGFGSALVNAWSRQYACGWLIGSTPFAFHFTPQHALASSLGALILLDNWHSSRFWRHAALGGLALLLWSPFVACSFGVIALARLPGRDVGQQLRALCTPANLALLPVMLMLVVYILASSQGIPLYACPAGGDVPQFAARYTWFALLEFGLLGALLLGLQCAPRRPLLAALGLLCALMLTWVGSSNDLQMRGSNLPMVLLMLLALQALQQAARPANQLDQWLRGGLLATLLLGCVSGWQELQRAGLNWQIGHTALRQPVFAVNWLAHNESMNYTIGPQYLARLRHDGWAYKMLRHQPGANQLTPVVPALQGLHWSPFGTAQFDASRRIVQSAGMTDAALVSDELALPAGLYRIDLLLDWDTRVEQEDGTLHAGHVSLLGQRKLAAFGSGKLLNHTVTLFVQLDGQPQRLAFGLGGWGKASGWIQLRAGSISRVSRIGVAATP